MLVGRYNMAKSWSFYKTKKFVGRYYRLKWVYWYKMVWYKMVMLQILKS